MLYCRMCVLKRLFWVFLAFFPPILPAAERGIFSVQIENDGIVGQDRHYTNGLQLSYFPLAPLPDWMQGGLQALGMAVQPDRMAVEYSIGQTIFTPEDIENPAPQPDERPWAGHSYGSIALFRKLEPQGIFEVGEKFDLVLGMVGPNSGAASAQVLLHDMIGSPEPRGWSNQIGNELTANLHYFRKWMYYPERDKDWELEFSPVLGGAVGSPYTYLTAGFSVRWGPDLRRDYGPPSIQPTYPGSSFFLPGDSWNGYFMAGVEYRQVYYNLFLDGPLLQRGPSIEKYRDVGEFFIGAVVSYQKVRFSFTQVYRSREFHTQKERDVFGALNLSLYF